MRKFWDRIFGLDDHLSIWVEEQDLGSEKLISHKNQNYYVMIPRAIDRQMTLRLKGLGKTRFHKTGDLYLRLWQNKGEDFRKSLWISETSARNGGEKILVVNGRRIIILIPPNSYHGLTIRLKGLGAEPMIDPCAPALQNSIKGDLFVKLIVYPDRITSRYERFDALSTENMFLEGWVYRKYDEVMVKLGPSHLPDHPVQVERIIDLFNDCGYWGIFEAFVDHMKLSNLNIELTISNSITTPGACEITGDTRNTKFFGTIYRIKLNRQFMDDPFVIAAILAHELCHVIFAGKIGLNPHRSEEVILEEERMTDLLVFMFQIGEFQLRVAKSKGLTLGYFNQVLFERMQVIVSRKLKLD